MAPSPVTKIKKEYRHGSGKRRWQTIAQMGNHPLRLQESVRGAIDGIERKTGVQLFRTVVKSITVDNGSEFLDHDALERIEAEREERTLTYYEHSSRERGSNENANRMIRCFGPAGSDISKLSRKRVREIEEWINSYPRGILGFETTEEWFNREMGT